MPGDDSQYNLLVSKAFSRILKALDGCDPEVLDAESTGDMLTVTAKSGEKCIVNTQRAVHQIWVAGQGMGVHFSHDAGAGRWQDDKGKGLELFRFVGDCVEAMSGVRLSL